MATIRASCLTQGDVELTSRDVTVRVCAADNQGSYTFRCPACALAVAKPADPKIVDLLVSSGVRLSVWHLPAELAEAHEGLPITYDDPLEFHLLQQEGWSEALVSSVGFGGPGLSHGGAGPDRGRRRRRCSAGERAGTPGHRADPAAAAGPGRVPAPPVVALGPRPC